MTALTEITREQHVETVLRIADTSLLLGQRLSEWCGHGPIIEEDIALSNIALDLIGQARLLLTHAGRLEGQGRDEDQLAFLRDEKAFRNLSIVELPNRDFARTMLRNFLVAAWQDGLWRALAASSDAELAIFRALQEALSNVVRHAEAKSVQVQVQQLAGQIVLAVRDDGRGFASLRNGRLIGAEHRMGIAGMRERLMAVSGDIQLTNRTPGAEVRISVPIPMSVPA
jgi:hypothetical protein